MGILTSYLGNQMGDNPSSSGDFLSSYFGQHLANANATPPQANAIPKTTTISTDESGDTTVTQKQTISKDNAPQPVSMPQSYQATLAAQPPVQGTQPFQNAVQEPPISQPPIQQPPMPQAQGPVASQQPPAAPQQAQPYQPPQAPQGTFGRMIQAESGGQQTGPNGQILTSPKGAVGIAQIMPSTAAQPGYGIAPATPQELATPQGNMLFGQRYFEGMYNKFGQDPEKAAAAYNAGPGTIEKAMLQADQRGGTWKDYVPDETKKYLTKVFPAGEETQKKYGAMIAGVPSSDVGMTPEEQAIHHIVLNSGDVNALGTGTYAGDHLIDPATKKAYADQHATVLQQNQMEGKAEKKAQDLIANGGVGLQRALKDDSEEGSYLKAYLFQRLGLHDLAKNEQQKLGAGDQWAQTMVNGAPAWVKYNGQGAPVKGYTAEGELSSKELVQTSGLMKNAEVGTQIYADPTSATGARYAIRRINGQAQVINVATQAIETDPTVINRLTPLGVGGTIAVGAERKYEEHGAGAQGKAAGEGYTPNPLPQRPGTPFVQGAQGPAVPQTQGPGAVNQAQQNQVGGTMSQGGPQGGPAVPQTQIQAPQQVPQGYQSQPVAGAVPQQNNVPVYQQKIQGERGAKRNETVDKVIDTEYREEARAGDIVSNTRKQQFAIFDRPGINSDRLFGLYNSAAEGTGDQKYSIIRDIIGGQFKPEAEVSQRLAQLDLSPQEKSALMEYNTANQRINAATLKQNSGPGSISDSEQRANKEANVDITKVPALGAYNAMSQSQFTGDLARAKMDWAAGQNFSNAAQMDKAWRKEQANLTTMYADIAKQRAEWIAKNGATTSAVKEGYKRFPIPEYDPNTESWKKTKPLNEIFGNKEKQ